MFYHRNLIILIFLLIQKVLIFRKTLLLHSSEIRGLCLMK